MDFNEPSCYAIVRSIIEKSHVRRQRIDTLHWHGPGERLRYEGWALAFIHQLPYFSTKVSKLVLVAYQDYLGTIHTLFLWLLFRCPRSPILSARSAPLFLALANQALDYQLYACLLINTIICWSITSNNFPTRFQLIDYSKFGFEDEMSLKSSRRHFLKISMYVSIMSLSQYTQSSEYRA